MATATEWLLANNGTSRFIIYIEITGCHFQLLDGLFQERSKSMIRRQKISFVFLSNYIRSKHLLVLRENGTGQCEFRAGTD